jgi:hypothetical protein
MRATEPISLEEYRRRHAKPTKPPDEPTTSALIVELVEALIEKHEERYHRREAG